jgi:hypothetical protein
MNIKQKSTNRKPSHNRMERLWRGRLQKLCRVRFGNHVLPDDDAGRAMLTALLCFGLTPENAIEDAPWCAAELAQHKRRAKRMKWRDVGELIDLTFEEWKQCKLFMMRPVNASLADIEAWREKQRKESWRRSKAKLRAKEKLEKEARMARAHKATNSPRQTAILEILVGRGEGRHEAMSVPELVRKARKLKSFARSRCQNVTYCDGHVATPRNLRDAVHEVVNQLVRKCAVETYTSLGDRGPVRWVVMLNRTSTGASETSVGASDGAFGGNASKIKDFTKTGVCPHALREKGDRTAKSDGANAEQAA